MGNRVLEIGAAVLVGIIAVFAVAALRGGDDASTPGPTTSLLEAASPLGTEAFVEKWTTARRATVAIEGTLMRFRGSEQLGSIAVRSAHRDDRWLDQTGATALVIADGQRRSCERFQSGTIACTDPERAPTVEQEAELIRQRIDGDAPGYVVYASDEPDCLLLVAVSPSPGAVWGQSTTFCFDGGTGAISRQETLSGDRRDLFEAQVIRAEVTDADLDPR